MMNPEMIDEVAELFKALSEPMRLRLLMELMNGEKTVSGLSEFSGTTMANVSKHLAFMKRAGIVERRKSGNLVYYSIGNDNITDMCDSICLDIEKRFESRKPTARIKRKSPPSGIAAGVQSGQPATRRPAVGRKTKSTSDGEPDADKRGPEVTRVSVAEETEPAAAAGRKSTKKEPLTEEKSVSVESTPSSIPKAEETAPATAVRPDKEKNEPAAAREQAAKKTGPATVVEPDKTPPEPAETTKPKPRKQTVKRGAEPETRQPGLFGLDKDGEDDNLLV